MEANTTNSLILKLIFSCKLSTPFLLKVCSGLI
jgi:hypothetical protein